MAAGNKKYEVVLNAGALGLEPGQNVKEVSAASFVSDANTARVTFYDADGNEVAFFQHAMSVTPKS
jgi:hypothetical protein